MAAWFSRSLVFGAGLALAALAPASAAPVVFTGIDAGASSGDPRTNSDAAAANFDAAASGLGTLGIINFESAALGTFTSLAAAPGVTLSGTDYLSGDQSVVNVAQGAPDSLFGYNTTLGGSKFAYINGGTLRFDFADPIVAFGGYFSGIQLGGETIIFSDGSSQTVTLPNPDGGNGGLEIVGFTDIGKLIAAVTIVTPNPSNSNGDFIGFDDVRFVVPGASSASGSVPEPVTLSLFGAGLAGAAALRRRKAAKA
jgi:hypothetical protein